MRVLVACEESQTVCSAFRAHGHEAYSCDVQKPSGGHPEWHVLGDATKRTERREKTKGHLFATASGEAKPLRESRKQWQTSGVLIMSSIGQTIRYYRLMAG